MKKKHARNEAVVDLRSQVKDLKAQAAELTESTTAFKKVLADLADAGLRESDPTAENDMDDLERLSKARQALIGILGACR